MKAGVYLVKNEITEEEYIVAINGKEPFLRITNAIKLSEFANGVLDPDENLIAEMLQEPSHFSLKELSSVVQAVPEPEQPEIDITDEVYKELISGAINPDTDLLNKFEIIPRIQKKFNLSWEEAQAIFEDFIESRFFREARDGKLYT